MAQRTDPDTNTARPSRRRIYRRRVWWAWVGYWIILFIATHLPKPPAVLPQVDHVDKGAHFALYAGLCLLGGYSHRLRYHRFSVAALVTWAFIYMAYGAADEWLQGAVGRTPSFWDWLADVAGVALGTLVLFHYRGKVSPSSPSTQAAQDRVL